jgi:hypothetical protein
MSKAKVGSQRHPGALRALIPTTALLVVGLVIASNARADVTFPLHACSSPWMVSAGSAWGTSWNSWTLGGGPPANFMVSFKPTKRGRTAPPAARSFHWIWNDLRRCVMFPSDLSPTQSDSLYKQMMCHVFWSTGPIVKNGGNTWDFEAWRPTVSRAAVLAPTQISDKNKRCNWGPDTGPAIPPPPPPVRSDRACCDARLNAATSAYLQSSDGRYRFVMQSDGNLVLYGPSGAIWATSTVGRGANHLRMQGDGNLVMYNAADRPVWASSHYNTFLIVQNDGNVVIYDGGRPIWATATAGRT